MRARHGRPEFTLPDLVSQRLINSYDWPGNVRELEHVMERVVLLAARGTVRIAALPEHLRGHPSEREVTPFKLPSGGLSLDALEKEAIRAALARADGNQSEAAGLLDVTRKTLVYRMQKHGLDAET